MRISAALPGVFKRAYPSLDPTTQMLSAISLLQFHEIDALPISFASGQKQRAVYGYTCLSRLLRLDPSGFGPFLERQCEDASEPLVTVGGDELIESLFETFREERFGFAHVEDRTEIGGLVTLADVLELYETGGLETDLLVRDVASPIFTLPNATSLRDALLAMFSRRIRRLFMSGGVPWFISDRTIIGHVFSPAVIAVALRDSRNVLDMHISEIGTLRSKVIDPESSIRAASIMLREQRGQCLVCTKEGGLRTSVVTPWDLVMKPWIAGALTVRDQV